MSPSMVIFQRELRSYFLSPIAYVIGVLFLVFGSVMLFWFGLMEVGRSAEANMGSFFSGYLPWAFILLVPALTMRLWAEERQLGTLELLLTFPVRNGQLISGKFLGALVFIMSLLALTLIYPLSMSLYGNLDWGPVIGGYLGAILLAAAYLSLGLFISSLFKDQIIALLVSVVLLLVLVLMGHPIVGLFFNSFFTELFALISPMSHFQSIGRGVVDLGDIVYYVAFCAFFLTLNGLVLNVRKQKG
jgi:ABC-2 type transport system permease protein